ncbi:BZ3500_MvSof-1268-A1-R1_Chr1-3g01895 [Microbotryum saponariae]|uniref:Peroxisomal ATPase PEX1 n=1 Tax=Microbotryum saponariae TaxID=289078 RepID=A0A2X0KRM2_9BASI|nr:BZ3500_MvSof-1268-A1-R1_Chr1-3g01895 [Microbotryum saponariae]SCZ94848.1 BZ3501_MvSof-1269-A2-R1_Chr1-3g01497 [Microbotryum saponariae]
MGRTAVLTFASLRNCLVNLPLSITGPLTERGIAPQSLVIELSFPSQTNPPSKKTGGSSNGTSKAYVGWTGLPSSVASVAQHARSNGGTLGDKVEVDPQFAVMLGLGMSEGMPVTIELMRDLPTATSVAVTPVSADDWEILETNAEFVEMNLLNQVRAVKEGMMVGCWVGGTTLVRFTVDATTPPASPAVLLTSATELLVAPRTRSAKPQPLPPKVHDLSSDTAAVPSSVSPEWDRVRKRLVRLLPLEVMPSSSSSDIAEPQSSVLRSGSNEEFSIYDAFIAPTLYHALARIFPSLRVAISHHPRPPTKGPDAPSTNPDEAGKDSHRKQVDVRIKLGREIQNGQIWLSEAARQDLGIGLDRSFELLKFQACLTLAARKARLANEAKPQSASSPSSTHLTNGYAKTAHSRVPLPRSPPTTSINGHKEFPLHDMGSVATKAAPRVHPVLAGVEDKLQAIRSHVVNSLAARTLNGKRIPTSGILVTGNSGAGKTVLVQQIGRELEIDPRTLTRTLYIDCSKYTEERQSTLKAKMKDWFDEAYWHAPALLVLDNLDRMLGAEVEHADSFPALHLAHTFLSLATPALSSRPIVLIATAQSSTSLHPLLTTTHLLGETISLRGPNKAGRKDVSILSYSATLTETTRIDLTPPSPVHQIVKALVGAKAATTGLVASSLDYTIIAGLTEGYLPADLSDLVGRAIHQSAMRTTSSTSNLELGIDDFHAAQIGFMPLSLRDVKLQKSDVQWADIGGLHETRRVMRETLEWPTKYGAIFASCPLRLRSGLLLYGYPGCGKTLLASAVAKECGLNFISVKGPEILNKYIGASEKSVRDLFERAQAAKPCILFFDEFDSIAPKRGHDSTGVTDRVVNQMLTQMDGAEGLDGVYVLAATSRPDLIDPALLRPGRLDKSLLCDMPSLTDRLEVRRDLVLRERAGLTWMNVSQIIQASARKIALDPSVDLNKYAAKTEGFSGADLQALVYNAHLDAIHETLNSTTNALESSAESKGKTENEDITYTTLGGPAASDKVLSRAEQATVNKRLELILSTIKAQQASKTKIETNLNGAAKEKPKTHVTPLHLDTSMASTRPSVPAEELTRLRRIYNEFVDGRSANGLPSGQASEEIGGRASLM